MQTAKKTITRTNQIIRPTVELTKAMPYDLEMEEMVIGTIISERQAMIDVSDILIPECFFDSNMAMIFEVCLQLERESRPIDSRIVNEYLKRKGFADIVGGLPGLAQLTTKISSPANIVTHARILQEYYIKRKIIQITNTAQKDAFEDVNDPFIVKDNLEKEVFELSRLTEKRQSKSIGQLNAEKLSKIQTGNNAESDINGVPSGYEALDKITGGWQNSDLIILAGRPGMAKTALALNFGMAAGITFKIPVGIYSLEMASYQLVNRMDAAVTEIELSKIITNRLDDVERNRFTKKTAELSNAPIFVDDTPALSVLELRAKVRRSIIENGIRLVIVDYLQLMKAEGANREAIVGEISRGLKAIAKEFNVPVIALSSLSRSCESRADKRPQLSDLRESGSIESDADIVLFLYRDEYYKISQDQNGMPTAGIAELIIAKHRNGSSGDTIKLKFSGVYQKFSSLSTLEYY